MENNNKVDLIRDSILNSCVQWHMHILYDKGMTALLQDSKVIGSVDDLISFIKNKKYSKRKTSRVFIEFFSDFQELKKKEDCFDESYLKIQVEDNSCMIEKGMFRVVVKANKVYMIIMASRYAKKGEILLV